MNPKLNELTKFLTERSVSPSMTRDEIKNEFYQLRSLVGEDFASLQDTIMIVYPEARAEFNIEAENWCTKRGLKFTPVSYGEMARDLRKLEIIDEETYNRAAGGMGTTDNPGFSSAKQTTVADFMLRTIGQLGNIWGEVRKEDLRNRGNFQITVNTAAVKSQWRVNETDNFVNLNTTIEGGTSTVNLIPRSFGSLKGVTSSFENVLSGFFLFETNKMLLQAHEIAKDDAVLNGTGSNQPTGMNLNALTGTTGNPTVNQFKLGGTLVESILNASARISAAVKAGKNRQVLFMNSTFEGNLLNERLQLTNDDMSGLITIKDGSVVKVGAIRTVINDEVITNDGNNNSIGTLAVPEYYIWGFSEKDKMSEDRSSGFDASILKAKVEGTADGKPGFNNAFAKINSNNN